MTWIKINIFNVWVNQILNTTKTPYLCNQHLFCFVHVDVSINRAQNGSRARTLSWSNKFAHRTNSFEVKPSQVNKRHRTRCHACAPMLHFGVLLFKATSVENAVLNDSPVLTVMNKGRWVSFFFLFLLVRNETGRWGVVCWHSVQRVDDYSCDILICNYHHCVRGCTRCCDSGLQQNKGKTKTPGIGTNERNNATRHFRILALLFCTDEQ